MQNLKLGSLFDGSGGFPLGGMLAGITPVWASEVEPFAVRVTTKRIPFMKHYGDISAMDGGKIEPVDIITFGSPCQDMSVAGKRSGLDGSRSSLFYEAVRIIKEMRSATNGKYPRYIVWENVPGAFSSNGGRDFKAVLEAVIGIVEENAEVPSPEGGWPYADLYLGDGWSVAYRTLDAQFWGVPQRRRRIFLVADFAGGSAPDVLFKSEGLSGYSTESFRTWQRTANDTEDSLGTASISLEMVLNDQGGNRMDVTEEVTATLRAEAHHPPCVIESAGFCTEHSAKARNIGYAEECSPTLRSGVVPATLALENHPNDGRIKIEENDKVQTLSSRMGTGGNNVPLVMNASSTWDGKQVSPTLTKQNAGGNQRMPDKDNFNCVIQPSYAMTTGSFTQVEEECSPTLMARDYKDPNTVVHPYGFDPSCARDLGQYFHENCGNTVINGTYPGHHNGVMETNYTVRRLTPTECARLQGFPDNWCQGLENPSPTDEEVAFWLDVWDTYSRVIGNCKPKTEKQVRRWLANPHSDSAEYKLWGNGVALPCVFFVLAGIVYCTHN